MGKIHISVVIPAYNEAGSIEATVREVCEYLAARGLSHEVIVVDDGSTDLTAPIVEALSKELASVRLWHYEPNRGKGHAVRVGVLASKGDRVLFTDADNATPMTELPALLSALDSGYDAAIASRSVRGAVRVVHQPAYRELGGKVLNLVIRILAVPGIHDTQCGFKLFTRDAADAIFPHCFINNFSFDVEVLYLAGRLGFKTLELPVHWTHHSGSKVRPLRDGATMLLDTARIRLHNYEIGRGRGR